MSDGDLWEHFALAIKAKGAHAVKVSWVKGHAQDRDIKAGISDLFKQAMTEPMPMLMKVLNGMVMIFLRPPVIFMKGTATMQLLCLRSLSMWSRVTSSTGS